MTLNIRTQWTNLALASSLAAILAGGCGDDKPSATDAAIGDGSAGGAGGTPGAGGAGLGGSPGAGGRGGAGGTPGAGGSDAGAGAGGAGGSAVGGDAAAACNIPCLQNLFTGCELEGTCTESMSGMLPGPVSTNSCYTNGVKSQFSIAFTGVTLRTFKAGGAACWTMEIALADVQTGKASIKDGTGAVVATITVDPATMKQTITCTATGMTYDASMCGDVPSGMPDPNEPDDCTPGVCMIP
jgi:hypothetical protein